MAETTDEPQGEPQEQAQPPSIGEQIDALAGRARGAASRADTARELLAEHEAEHLAAVGVLAEIAGRDLAAKLLGMTARELGALLRRKASQ